MIDYALYDTPEVCCGRLPNECIHFPLNPLSTNNNYMTIIFNDKTMFKPAQYYGQSYIYCI